MSEKLKAKFGELEDLHDDLGKIFAFTNSIVSCMHLFLWLISNLLGN